MCKSFLSFLANLYSFNIKITRTIFLKYNFIFTIVLGIIFFSEMDVSLKMIVISSSMLLAMPIGIYQVLNYENPNPIPIIPIDKMICFGTAVSIFIMLNIFISNIFLVLPL